MRKISLFLLAAMLLCAMNVYSGGKSDAGQAKAGEPFTVRVWGGVPPEAGPQGSVDEFNRLYKDKGFQAEYTRFVNDDNGNLKLETTLLSGDAIDVYITYSATPLRKRIDSNMALDITDLIARDSFDIAGFGNLADQYKFNNRYYSIPTKVDLYGILINKNMFEAAGIPIPTKWNYTEFRNIAKRLTKGSGDNKVYGMFFNTQQDIYGPFIYFGISAMGGNYLYSQDGKRSGFDAPVVRETTQLIYDMMNVDQSAPSHTDSVTQKLTQEGMFLTGKSAMSIGPWIVRSIKDLTNYPHDFVTAFVPYPSPDNRNSVYSQGGAGDMLSINPKSKNIEAAWEYIKWYSTKGMIPVAKGGRVPLYAGYNAAEVTAAFLEGGEKLLDEATTQSVLIAPRQNYAVQTITNKAPELNAIFREELEAMWNGAKTVDRGLTDAKTRGDKLLSE
jgi:multiple sugar transport system substrate-binding protein